MGFGAIVTSSDAYTPVPDLQRWLVEARVEMELSKPTKFAIRFDDTNCEGGSEVFNHPAIQSNEMIGIFVRAGKKRDKLECLVFGPVTKIHTASMIGGDGSWVEVRGEDRRVVMNRVGVQATWDGFAADAAKAILDVYEFEYEIENTLKTYDAEHNNGLSQRATDLAFLEDIARRNVFEFWLDYAAEEMAATGGITLTTTARMKSSPPKGGAFLIPGPPILIADQGLEINVNPPPDKCVKVTKFDARVDFERPNAALGFGQKMETAEPVQTPGEETIEPVTPDWNTLREIDGVKREQLTAAVPDPDEQQLAERAMLNEAAWFVEVDCSTTLEMIEFCVKPHMIVDVKNAGPRLTGAFQVKSAIHVINAADHFIDFKLRANGLRFPGAI
jgi:hypothetical protein